jgi:hypothetical protein
MQAIATCCHLRQLATGDMSLSTAWRLSNVDERWSHIAAVRCVAGHGLATPKGGCCASAKDWSWQ